MNGNVVDVKETEVTIKITTYQWILSWKIEPMKQIERCSELEHSASFVN